MRKSKRFVLTVAILLPFSHQVQAAEKCIATALMDTPAVEDDGTPRPAAYAFFKKKGEIIEPSQYWSNIALGRPTFCEHGGYCFVAANFATVGTCTSGQIVQQP